jgi:hypothetical protein
MSTPKRPTTGRRRIEGPCRPASVVVLLRQVRLLEADLGQDLWEALGGEVGFEAHLAVVVHADLVSDNRPGLGGEAEIAISTDIHLLSRDVKCAIEADVAAALDVGDSAVCGGGCAKRMPAYSPLVMALKSE